MAENRNDRNHFLQGLFIGGLFGALAGILFAPKSGKELRSDLKEKGSKTFEDVSRICSDSSTKAKAILDDARSRLGELKKEADRQLAEARMRAKKILSEGEGKIEEMVESAKEVLGEELSDRKET